MTGASAIVRAADPGGRSGLGSSEDRPTRRSRDGRPQRAASAPRAL